MPASSDDRSAQGTLAAVFREHLQFVWRSAQRLGASPDEADDVVQDVFMVVARKLQEGERPRSPRTWLFAITARVMHNHRRAFARHQRRRAAVRRVQNVDDPVRRGNDPYRRGEAAQELYHLMNGLDDGRRAIYILIELEGMTAVEVADGLGVNLNTVYTRLRAARRHMKEGVAASLRTPPESSATDSAQGGTGDRVITNKETSHAS